MPGDRAPCPTSPRKAPSSWDMRPCSWLVHSSLLQGSPLYGPDLALTPSLASMTPFSPGFSPPLRLHNLTILHESLFLCPSLRCWVCLGFQLWLSCYMHSCSVSPLSPRTSDDIYPMITSKSCEGGGVRNNLCLHLADGTLQPAPFIQNAS